MRDFEELQADTRKNARLEEFRGEPIFVENLM